MARFWNTEYIQTLLCCFDNGFFGNLVLKEEFVTFKTGIPDGLGEYVKSRAFGGWST